jgi:LacI family transcriptional regulator
MKTNPRSAHRPTAVVAISDRTAFGAISAVREAGLTIPRDLALRQHRQCGGQRLHLSCAHHLPHPQTRDRVLAMQKLHRIIEGKPELAVKSVVYGELIVRESCGAPVDPGTVQTCHDSDR